MNKRLWGLIGLITLNLIMAIATLTFGQGDAPLPLPSPDSDEDTLREGYTRLGDMVIPESMLTSRAGFNADAFSKWPKVGDYYEVPYVFATDITKPSYVAPVNRDRTREAMRGWEAVSAVRFVPRTTQADYLRIINSDGNWSYVGRIGGVQLLGIYNWDYNLVIVHELGHALGLLHEQSRIDRDQYVEVLWQNIAPGAEANFYTWEGTGIFAPYNFNSVMHYDQYAFSVNGQPTLRARPPYEGYNRPGFMGRPNQLSRSDEATMNWLYPHRGDLPSNAIPLAEGVNTINIDNGWFNMFAEPRGDCASVNQSTLWYTFRPSVTGTYTFNSRGESYSYSHTLIVWRRVNGQWHVQGCKQISRDFPEGVQFEAQAGVRYYLMVVGDSYYSGNVNITWSRTDNLLSHGGFEAGTNGWTISSTGNNDRIVCNGYIGAERSNCAMEFIGGVNEASSVSTVATFPAGWTFAAGDTYTLSYSLRTRQTTHNLRPRVFVRYRDGTRQSFDLPAQTGSAITSYLRFESNFTIPRADVRSITVRFLSTGTATDFLRLDNVRLVRSSGGVVAPLPLPAP